jgi:hypothetical protein
MVSNAAEIFPVWLNCHFRETQHRASEALAGVYYWTVSTSASQLGHGVRCPDKVAVGPNRG